MLAVVSGCREQQGDGAGGSSAQDAAESATRQTGPDGGAQGGGESSDGQGANRSSSADGGAPESSRQPAGDAAVDGVAASRSDAGMSDAGGGVSQGDDADRPMPVDAGGKPDSSLTDAGAAEDPDAALGDASIGLGVGSCCAEHATPGCSNADLQVCVCERLSTCCTDAWTAACVLIVTQKYCQPGVRDCVCGSEEGQWQRISCCESSWDEFCDEVAESKCGALPGCM